MPKKAKTKKRQAALELTPATVRSAMQEAVKKAIEARDIAWMRSIEKYRRSWEKALSELVREMDGGLHKVPFEPPPQEFTVQVVFGKGFGGPRRAAQGREDQMSIIARRIAELDSLFDDPAEQEPQPHVLLLTPRWSEIVFVDPGTEDLCFVRKELLMDAELTAYLRLTIADRLLTLSIPVKRGAYELHPSGSMKTFGLRRLGPGTWLVEPSLNMPDAPEPLHVYLVLCEVPHPAPWEKK